MGGYWQAGISGVPNLPSEPRHQGSTCRRRTSPLIRDGRSMASHLSLDLDSDRMKMTDGEYALH